MEPLLYLIAIMGCGESDTACREVRVEPARYQSEAACLAATESALLRNSDLLFPNVVAQCRRADGAPVLLRGSEVMQPAPAGVRQEPVRIASARR